MADRSIIEPDKPLHKIEDEALGVASLATKIATNIVKLPSGNSLVIGLYGRWGMGKTTFIGFIKQALNALEIEQLVILNFNPWLFSGREDLIQRLLIELAKSLSPAGWKIQEIWRSFYHKTVNLFSLSEKLIFFGASLSGNPLLATGVKTVGSISNREVKKLSKQKPLSEQKAAIEKLLRKSDKKILIIIDDIDRLDEQEVRDIFKMVKSIVDFPNVIYLLSFDRDQICRVIGNNQTSDGNEYLEKIIQYSIDLPHPDSAGVLKIFSKRVDPLIEREGNKIWDKNRWSNIYRDYLRKKMKTPRQAIRLSNAFNVDYPALIGEVDPVDFLAIEALRMFNPEIYAEIRSRSGKFTELGKDELDSEKKDPIYFEEFLKLSEEHDREVVKSLIMHLFPRVKNAFSNFKDSTTQFYEWRTQARACSKYHFDRYFTYSIVSNQFSETELVKAIDLSKDVQKFEELLIGYRSHISEAGSSRLPEFFERLLDFVEAGTIDSNLNNIVKTLIICGDLLIREEDEDRSGFFRIETDSRISWILLGALKRLPQEQIYPLLKTSYQESKSLHIPSRLLNTLGREHGKYQKKEAEVIRYGEQPFLTLEQHNDLESILLSKIKAAAVDRSLIENNDMHHLLYRWRDFTDSYDEQRSWVSEISDSDNGLKKLLIKFSGISVISDGQGSHEETNIQIDSVKNFLDIEDVFSRAKNC